MVDKIGQFAWSSHWDYLSETAKWEWLHKNFVLEMLAKYRVIQIKEYKQFVENQDTEELVSYFDKANLPAMLGNKKFVEWVKAVFFNGNIDKDIPQSKVLAPDRRTIIKTVCDFYAVA